MALGPLVARWIRNWTVPVQIQLRTLESLRNFCEQGIYIQLLYIGRLSIVIPPQVGKMRSSSALRQHVTCSLDSLAPSQGYAQRKLVSGSGL